MWAPGFSHPCPLTCGLSPREALAAVPAAAPDFLAAALEFLAAALEPPADAVEPSGVMRRTASTTSAVAAPSGLAYRTAFVKTAATPLSRAAFHMRRACAWLQRCPGLDIWLTSSTNNASVPTTACHALSLRRMTAYRRRYAACPTSESGPKSTLSRTAPSGSTAARPTSARLTPTIP